MVLAEEQAMKELIVEHSGREMMVQPAVRAAEGRWSGPVAQLGLSEARVLSHHSGVAKRSERVGIKGGRDSVNGSEWSRMREELTEVK